MAKDAIAVRYVQIKPTTEGIKGELTSELSGAGESAGAGFSNGFSKMLGGASGTMGTLAKGAAALAGATVAVGTAAAGATTALVANTAELASYGDNIDKMSQKMGISAEAYQEWEAVMQHSGTSMETMKAGMKTLANAVENGNDAFERIGITAEEIGNMSQEDLFGAVISGLQDVENETERTYLAGQLLGRGATELGALLNTSAEDTQAMKDRVHELGGVLSDEAVKASARFQDSLQDMTTGLDGMKRKLTADFLPAMADVMDGIGNIFSGDTTAGVEQLTAGVDAIMEKVTTLLPRFTEMALPIIQAIGQGIIQSLPTILPVMADFVLQLGTVFIQYLPQLVEVGAQVIVQLAQGIASSLPTLIPTIVEAALLIVQTLLDNLPLLIDAAVQLITGLTEGLIAAMPILLEKMPMLVQQTVDAIIANLPTIISCIGQIMLAVAEAVISNAPQILAASGQVLLSVAAGIIEAIPTILASVGQIFIDIAAFWGGKVSQAVEWGKDLIKNFIDGIKAKFGDLKKAVMDLASMVADIIGFSEPEIGPLSNFHTYAPDMMELFAQGIKQNENVVNAQIKKSFDFETEIKAGMPVANEQIAFNPMVDVSPVALAKEDGGLSTQFGQAVELLGKLVDKDPVEIGANADGIFNLIRKQNSMFIKSNGRSALA